MVLAMCQVSCVSVGSTECTECKLLVIGIGVVEISRAGDQGVLVTRKSVLGVAVDQYPAPRMVVGLSDQTVTSIPEVLDVALEVRVAQTGTMGISYLPFNSCMRPEEF